MIEQLKFTMPNVIALAEVEKICFGKDAWSIQNLRGEFQNDFSHFFAEIQNGKIVGYICVRTVCEEAQVCNIAVLPDFRRQGIASELIKCCLRYSAQSCGCTKCELEVNTQNVPAYELYRKCGFYIAGIRKNFYRKSRYATRDAYTMVADLT